MSDNKQQEKKELKINLKPKFSRRNINGKWETIEVSGEEVIQILKETSLNNAAILNKLHKTYGPGTEFGFSEAYIVALFNMLGGNFHYAVENYIDAQIEKK